MATTKIQTFGGNVGIGTDDPGSYKLKVIGGNVTLGALEATSISINGITNIHIPPGIIGLWADPDNIPPGWGLCDGSTYGSITSPNMGGKFAISYDGVTYNVAGTGGSNSITLVSDNIPQHSHTHPNMSPGGTHSHNASVTSNGSHKHNGSVSSAGLHNHNMGAGQFILTFSPVGQNYSSNAVGGQGNHQAAYSDNRAHNHGASISSAGSHAHTGTMPNAGSHNHPVSCGNAGQVTPTAVDIKPAHHILCFIIKT